MCNLLLKPRLVLSFSISQCSVYFRFGRNRYGGSVIIYVGDDIPSKQLIKNKLPDDIEEVFIEVILRKMKWFIFGTYQPPSHPVEYFFKYVCYALDTYTQIYEKFFFLAGDFSTGDRGAQGSLVCLIVCLIL